MSIKTKTNSFSLTIIYVMISESSQSTWQKQLGSVRQMYSYLDSTKILPKCMILTNNLIFQIKEIEEYATFF